jgi:hypothetical protein
LLVPTLSGLPPKFSVIPIDCIPSKVSAFFSLFFEKLFSIEQVGKHADPTLEPHPSSREQKW